MKQSKKNKVRNNILKISLLLLCFLAGCGSGSSTEKLDVSIIMKSSESNFWKSVVAGAQTASNEYHANLTILAPENEEDYITQNQLLEDAIRAKTDAIVISAIDYNQSVELIEKARNQGIFVVVIDSDVNTKKVNAHIGTDNYEAGKISGNVVKEGSEERIYLGIINFDKNSQNGQERERGCLKAVKEDKRVKVSAIIHADSNIPDSSRATKQMLREHPEINVLVTFNEWTTLGVGYAIQELNLKDQVRVIGFDNNVISIGMLETGEMDTLLVQNPYAIGYLGIESACKLLQGDRNLEESIDTDIVIINKKNMLEEASQKILFQIE